MGGAAFLLAAVGLALAGCEAAVSTAPDQLARTNQAATASAFPELTGRVVDQAALLSSAQEARLTASLERLEARTTDQLVIVTVSSLGERSIEEYSLALANSWGIGQAGKDNGVLLLVAPNSRATRIEVGIGLEPILTNDEAKQIIDRDLIPYFREARWFEGIEAAASSISRTLIAEADVPRRGGS